VTDVSEEEAVAELREQIYREVLDLFEGDIATAELWLSSPVRALGNQAPVMLMDNEAGLLKVRNLIKKWEQGAVS
jgi:putative toxin-antitoxin system antitoxin component (TIGR02293 family)